MSTPFAKPLVANPSSSVLIKGKKQTLAQQFPELYSYSTNTQATTENILSTEKLEDHFHRPLSVQTHNQFAQLQQRLESNSYSGT
jgi:hypothetical protein